MPTEAKSGNGATSKILIGIILALLAGFIGGRFTGPSASNETRLDLLEIRVRVVENSLSQIQNDLIWIKGAMTKQGFQP